MIDKNKIKDGTFVYTGEIKDFSEHVFINDLNYNDKSLGYLKNRKSFWRYCYSHILPTGRGKYCFVTMYPMEIGAVSNENWVIFRLDELYLENQTVESTVSPKLLKWLKKE